MGCTNLNKVVFPATLQGIDDNVFMDCDNLKTIVFKSLEPPYMTNPTFPESVEEIIIPQGTLQAYQTAFPTSADKFIEGE